jgi:DNA mismatch endonuclease, patch repair protein
MADIVDAATRSRMMSGIRGKNTQPEISIRKAVHRLGFRYRLHSSTVTGKPDMVFPATRAVVFVNGCFWHGHDCKFFRLPSTRPEFWAAKIAANKTRDAFVRGELERTGWRHLTIWECAVRGQNADAPDRIAKRVAKWLLSKARRGEIRGS